MFRQHYEKMYNLARSILSDDDESKDVVSEVFTTILADDVVLMPESEEGFLMRSVRNRCLNLIAHKSVKEKVTKLLLDDADVILSEETDERLDQLMLLIEDLPKEWRGYFWLAKFLTICNLQLSYKPVFSDFKIDAKFPDDLDEMADVLLGLKLAGYDSVTYNQLEENFVKQFRIKNNILEFDVCDNEVKCLTFFDFFTAGEKYGNGDIMHNINMHHIDLLRKAFPKADVYHSEIIKDDVLKDLDLTFEKHISREKLPLDEMKEPIVMMVHLYERSYVLPSRKAYCDQLISLRKLFVDVV